jgi:ADP-heptose:LPS heptosyltransferase
MKKEVSIGIAFSSPDRLCSSIGDTLGLTPIIEKLSEDNNITVCTAVPELFYNNPHVKNILVIPYPNINISPCRCTECNIIQFYGEQLNIELSKETLPKIYLTSDEIKFGKNLLSDFDGSIKIAISTETYYDSKNLRYGYISPFFKKLKEEGCKLIGIGMGEEYQNEFDMSFINKTTLREALSILNSCDLFIGIDNGLFHCAAALNIPQVIFFRNNGSSNNKYINTHYVESKVKCHGRCLLHIPVCECPNRCMDNFDLDEYLELVKKIIKK